MKNLNLVGLGVQEMNVTEMKKHEGGIPQLVGIIIAACVGAFAGSAAGMGGTAWYLSTKTYQQY